MKNAKKWILSAIVLIGTVLAVTGMCIAYLKSVGQVTGTEYVTKLFDNNSFSDASDLSRACMAFAIMTVIFAGLTLILTAMQLFGVVRDNRVKMVTSAMSVICAIIAFVLICVLAKDSSLSATIFNTRLTAVESAPAVGAYLLAIGGIVAGLFGFFPVNAKKKGRK